MVTAYHATLISTILPSMFHISSVNIWGIKHANAHSPSNSNFERKLQTIQPTKCNYMRDSSFAFLWHVTISLELYSSSSPYFAAPKPPTFAWILLFSFHDSYLFGLISFYRWSVLTWMAVLYIVYFMPYVLPATHWNRAFHLWLLFGTRSRKKSIYEIINFDSRRECAARG